MSTSKSYLFDLKIPIDSNYVASGGQSDDDSDDDYDPGHDTDRLELAGYFDAQGDIKLERWFAGIECNPLRCAWKLIQLLRSSDQRREGLRKFIEDGNRHEWFTGKDDNGKCILLHIPQLELLRDVKTQWDSVYMMLERLRQLRPVSFSQ